MSYAAALENLYALGQELVVTPGVPRRKYELEQMRVLMGALGSPEHQFKSILIAGTNGKGSVSATLASILQCGGYRTGLYTSPHLTRPNERIRVDGVEIPDDDFGRLYFRVDEAAAQLVRDGKLPSHPSFFEMMTAVGFCWFAEQKIDIAVLEVGLGGRLDATNVVEPMVSVITDISLDHMEWLGTSLGEIAREKAGILRENGVLVTLSQHPEANNVIGEVAMRLHVRGVNAAEYMPPMDAGAWGARWQQSLLGETVEIAPALAGRHQHRNLALAIATAVEICNSHCYKLSASAIARGVAATRWPGRLERFVLPDADVEFWVDVAHNPAGAWALRSALSALPELPSTLVFGCLADKPVKEMAQILFPTLARVVLAPVDSPRAASIETMQQASEGLAERLDTARGLRDALKIALEGSGPRRIVLCGSLFLAGASRTMLVDEFDGRPA